MCVTRKFCILLAGVVAWCPLQASAQALPPETPTLLTQSEQLFDQNGGVGDLFGFAVAPIGDFDGDGLDDVLVGAPMSDAYGADSGAAYVFFGSETGVDPANALQLMDPNSNPNDQFGRYLAGAGDVNGDGCDDVVISSWLDDSNGTDSGSAWVFYGTGNSCSPLSTPTELVPITLPPPGDHQYFGRSVAGVGDANGDGFDDIAVSSKNGGGSVHVFYGSSSGIDPTSLPLEVPVKAAVINFGYSVAGAGDVNNDGFDDVIVGAPVQDSVRGAAYVFLGSPHNLEYIPGIMLTDPNGEPGDRLGLSVAGAGDVNNDGFDDVIVGAWGNDDNGTDSGAAFVFFGPDLTEPPLRLLHPNGAAGDEFGYSVSGAGDVNDDGVDDVIVGVRKDDLDSINNGSAVVFYGTSDTSCTGCIQTRPTQLVLASRSPEDRFGMCVAGAGDVNNDGVDDVIVGSYYYDSPDSVGTPIQNKGAAFVFYGGPDSVAADNY